jgi:hypothetical protein
MGRNGPEFGKLNSVYLTQSIMLVYFIPILQQTTFSPSITTEYARRISIANGIQIPVAG